MGAGAGVRAGRGEGAAAGLSAAPGAEVSLGGCLAPGGRTSGPLHPVLKSRSERTRLLGGGAVRRVLCRALGRKIVPGPWQKQKCYMQ